MVTPMRIGVALVFIALIGLAVAVALLGADPPASAVASPSGPARADPSPSPSALASTPPGSGGLASIDERVAFWEARVAASATDYSSTLALIDAYLTRVRATGDLADITRAQAALERARGLAPVNDVGLLLREGLVAFTGHDFIAAGEAARAMLDLDPGNEAGVALLGDASIELGDEKAAIAAYQELAPLGTAPVLSRLARYDLLTGDVEGAESTMRSAIAAAETEGFPDQVAGYRLQLAEFLRGENRLDEAAAEYEAVLVALPDSAAAMGGLARVHEAGGRRDEAIGLLERATAILPTPQLVAELGDLHALAGDDTRAAEAYALVERIAAVAQATGGVYDRQLVLFLADHDLRASDAVSMAAAELATRRDVFGYDAHAWALYRTGDLEAAAAAAEEAMRLGTPDGRILYHAGLIAAARGATDEARDFLSRANRHSASLPSLQAVELERVLDELEN